MNLNSVAIGSENPKRRRLLHEGVRRPAWSDGGFTVWQLGTGGVMVGPHDQVHGANTEPGRVMWNIETPDVQGEFERMVAAGATVVQEPYQPDAASSEMSLCTFSDPDGNYFQLASPLA